VWQGDENPRAAQHSGPSLKSPAECHARDANGDRRLLRGQNAKTSRLERSPNRDDKHQDLAQRNVEEPIIRLALSAASIFVINGVLSPKNLSVKLNQYKNAKNSATPQIRR
jgi:hypothetical protein